MDIRKKLDLMVFYARKNLRYSNSGDMKKAENAHAKKYAVEKEIIAYVQKLENRLMSSENLCLWCKHRGTKECVDCVLFSNHESMLESEE